MAVHVGKENKTKPYALDILTEYITSVRQLRQKPPIYLDLYTFSLSTTRTFLKSDRGGLNSILGVKPGASIYRVFRYQQNVTLTHFYPIQSFEMVHSMKDLYELYEKEQKWIKYMEKHSKEYAGIFFFFFCFFFILMYMFIFCFVFFF